MGRDRDDSGQYSDRIPPEAVLEVFEARDDAARPVTASDVVDELDIARRTAHNKLNALVERGVLETRKVGARGRVWWVPIPADDAADGVAENKPHGRRPDAVAENNPMDPGDDAASGDAKTKPHGRRRDDVDETAARASSERSELRAGASPAVDDGPSQDATGGATLDAVLEADAPGHVDRDAAVAAVQAARDYLRDDGPASMREIVVAVMPDHPLVYDAADAVETVEAGDRFRGAWWRKVVKPGLEALDDVEAPAPGQSNWRYVGDDRGEGRV